MTRLESLNNHLNALTAANSDNAYDEDIRVTIDEINKELGIGVTNALSAYSTKELHEELVNRESVSEIIVGVENEVSIITSTGDHMEKTNVSGPARILINLD